MTEPGTSDRTAHARAEALRLKWENRAAAEKVRASALARRVKAVERRELAEAFLAGDWVGAYADYLDRIRTREPVATGPSGQWQRKGGRDYPFYQTETELALLRAPARVLCGANGYAAGMVEGLTSYVIGTGIVYRVAERKQATEVPDGLKESAQEAVDEFLDRTEWYGGELPGLEEELFKRSVEDGEFLLLHVPLEDGRVDVRTAEPEQLTQKPGEDFEVYGFGVKTAPGDVQCPLAYWIQTGVGLGDGDEHDASLVTHFRRNAKRNSKRGVTDFAFDAFEALQQASVLRSNLGGAAAEQAAIVGVRQHQTATQEQISRFVDEDSDFASTDYLTGRQTPTRKTRRGWEDIPEGMGYVSGPGATNAPAHLSVLQSLLRAAGVRWNAPEWLISGDASNNNYASSLVGESPFVKRVLREQRRYREAFRRTMLIVLEHAADAGRVRDAAGRPYTWAEVKSLLDVTAEAPSPATRNRLEEAQVAAIEVPLGVESRQRYAQQQGRDFQQVLRDNLDYLDEAGGDGPELPDPGADE